MEIAKCRWCGRPARTDHEPGGIYVTSTCKHVVNGPSCATKKEAIEMWNEMMGEPTPSQTEQTDTDYRDRVDRMAAAILCGQWANHAVRTMQPIEVAQEAAMQIDAIDKMLKAREANP